MLLFRKNLKNGIWITALVLLLMLAGCQNNTQLVDQTKSSPSDMKKPNDVETQNEKILQDIKEK
jgi:hypothetical protein